MQVKEQFDKEAEWFECEFKAIAKQPINALNLKWWELINKYDMIGVLGFWGS